MIKLLNIVNPEKRQNFFRFIFEFYISKNLYT